MCDLIVGDSLTVGMIKVLLDDVILNEARNERSEESPKVSCDVSIRGDSSVASSLRMT